MPKITIPAHLPNLTTAEKESLSDLLFRFGRVRRRAYQMRRQGIPISMIEKSLQRETRLNARHIKDAYYSIKDLPASGVTFGGKPNQQLRMKHRITKEEYRRRRNSILLSRGEKTKKGNLNLRILRQEKGYQLRISLGRRKWITPTLFIPKKYLSRYEYLLDGSRPYMVLVKRRPNDMGFDVKIVVTVAKRMQEKLRTLALDINSGHIDFAVVDRRCQLVQVGRFDCYALLHASSNKRLYLLHQLVAYITRLARHFDAWIVVGRLNTGRFRSWNRRANRSIKQMPQYNFRKILAYKLRLQGIPVEERSEAYTSKVGQQLAPLIGLDVHKTAAILFALKVLDYEKFKALCSSIIDGIHSRGVRANEANGRQSARLSVGGGLTALPKTTTVWGTMKPLAGGGGHPVTPSNWGLSAFAESLKPNLARKTLRVRIC